MDTDTEGKSALASQNITVDNDAFVNLLDTIHNVNNVEQIKIDEIITKRLCLFLTTAPARRAA